MRCGLSPDELIHLLKHLVSPCGDLYRRTILGELVAERVRVGDLMALPLEQFENMPRPRERVQGMFCNSLAVHNASQPHPHPDSHIVDLARQMELDLYNCVIHSCTELGDSILRSWENPNFVSHYSARVDTIQRHLDPYSAMVKSHGNQLAVGLLTGTTAPHSIGSMSAADLCPQAFAVERDIIDLRKGQKVEKKVTALWTCPGCHSRSSTSRQVQDRSADEPASIYCTCTKCHLEFKAA
jgi:DNA-directed RNA polymerase subunit M/transcription elongation factor TFIIS